MYKRKNKGICIKINMYMPLNKNIDMKFGILNYKIEEFSNGYIFLCNNFYNWNNIW